MKKFKMILTGERPLIDVFHYLLGNYRYKLYYSKNLRRLIRSHIFEQIKYRIEVMDRDCYNNGECKICGCQTTALQMANKSCDKPCYPPMMTKKQWKGFLSGATILMEDGYWVRSYLGKPTKLPLKYVYDNKDRLRFLQGR